jgi:hypothetical protein
VQVTSLEGVGLGEDGLALVAEQVGVGGQHLHVGGGRDVVEAAQPRHEARARLRHRLVRQAAHRLRTPNSHLTYQRTLGGPSNGFHFLPMSI